MISMFTCTARELRRTLDSMAIRSCPQTARAAGELLVTRRADGAPGPKSPGAARHFLAETAQDLLAYAQAAQHKVTLAPSGAWHKSRAILLPMTHALRATVKSGRLILDEPVDLPEGTVVELMPVDQGDDLDDEDRARLHAALDRSQQDFLSGRGVPAEQVIAELRSKAGR